MSLETALENAAAAMNRLAAALESTRAPLHAVAPVVKTAPIDQETAAPDQAEKPAEKKETAPAAEVEKPAKKAEKPAKKTAEKSAPVKAPEAPIKQKVSDSNQESDRGNAAEGVKAEQAENFEAMTVKEFMEYVKDLATASTLDKSDVVKVLRNALTAAGQDSFHTLPVEARGDVVATLKAELDKMPW